MDFVSTEVEPSIEPKAQYLVELHLAVTGITISITNNCATVA